MEGKADSMRGVWLEVQLEAMLRQNKERKKKKVEGQEKWETYGTEELWGTEWR